MRRAHFRNTGTKGVFDPDLSERFDLEQYYDSFAAAMNTVQYPQGGYGDRGGFTLVSDADVLALGVPRRLRRRLEPIALTAGMITATNGGTSANLVDQDRTTLFTTGAVGAATFVAAEVDLGVARDVAGVDLIAFSCAGTPFNECLGIEYWTGSTWATFGGSLDNAALKHLRTTARTRRYAGWPGQATTARHWRVVVYGAVGAGAISVGGLRMWREGSGKSEIKQITMARSRDARYDLVLSDRNIDVYRNRRWQAAIPVPVASQQVRHVKAVRSIDTLVALHEQIETTRVVRQGSDGEWDVGAAPFTNTPSLTAGTAFSGSQDEIQTVDLTGVVNGDSVVMYLGDMITAPVAFTNVAAFAPLAVAALKALPGVDDDGVVATVNGNVVTFRFVNNNGNRAWPLVSACVLGKTTLPVSAVTQTGLDATSTLWGERTGWPRAGCFVQSRLFIGGFRAAPTTWRESVVSDFYNFLHTGSPLTAEKSFGGVLDTDMVETIIEVFVGRHLQIFTENGEWYMEATTHDATAVPVVRLGTRHGSERGVPPVFADGTSLFMQRGGETLRNFEFTDAEAAYKSDPMTLLAPHLVKGVVDMAHRQSKSVREGHQLLLVNADGSAAMLTLLRAQNVIATMPWAIDGAFRSVEVDADDRLTTIVERDGDNWLLEWNRGMPLDFATHVTGSDLTEIGHLGYLEGDTLWAYADDELVGPFVVSGAKITLPTPADDVWVGLEPAFFVRYPVIREKLQNAQPFRPPARIYEIELAVESTGGVTVGVNGKPRVEMPVIRYDGSFADGGPLQTTNGGDPGLPMMQRLYTGNIRRQGFTGWSEHPYFELGRPGPVPVHIKSARFEVADRG